MSAREEPDPVEAVRSDIEATRAEMAATVGELSDRLNPKKRIGAATQDVTDSAKQVAENAQGLTKDAATRAEKLAKTGVKRARRLTHGRERQMVGGTVLVTMLILVWRRRNRRR